MAEKTLGEDHPSTLDTVHNMGVVFRKQGEYGKALCLFPVAGLWITGSLHRARCFIYMCCTRSKSLIEFRVSLGTTAVKYLQGF